MRLLPFCVALLLLPAASAEDKPAEGKKVTTKDGKVSATFPAQPTEKKGLNMVVFLHEGKDGKTALVLNQGVLPQQVDLTDKDLVKKVLDGGREGGIRAIKGKLITNKEIKLGKYPGQSFDAEVSIGVYRARVYLTGKHMIQVVAVGSKEYVDGAEAKKFLDSLKLEE
jgi:hypothetical protein